MGLRDYDDYNNDDRRGRRGTRKTAVVIAFGILIALIILVVYLIANPDKKVEIAEKKTSESIRNEEKVESSSQNEKTEKLFNFTTQSSPVVESTEETKENEVKVDSAFNSQSIIEVPESEIVEVEVFPENTAEPELNETPLVDESVDEETPLEEETNINEETFEMEIIPQEEVPVEEETAAVEDEMPEEDISIEGEFPFLEEITPEEEPTLDDNVVFENKTEEEEVAVAIDVAAFETENSLDIEEEVYNPFVGVDSSLVVKASEGVYDEGRLIITGKSGSAVYSLSAGEVVETGRENGLKYVVVRALDGTSIKYSGFERVNVKNLSRVKESSVLGSIGSSTSNTIILEYISAE